MSQRDADTTVVEHAHAPNNTTSSAHQPAAKPTASVQDPSSSTSQTAASDASAQSSSSSQAVVGRAGSPDQAKDRPDEDVSEGHNAGMRAQQNGTLEVAEGAHNGANMNDSQNSDGADQEWSSDGFDPDLRRVKVYELIGTRWVDRGTAFCSGDFDEAAQEARLTAKSESNPNEILLSCTIRANDVYQRQQDTLIVWTEVDGTDFALSFQDVEGCSEVWDFIVEVQRHLSSKDETLSSSPLFPGGQSSTTQQIIQSGRLPTPESANIPEVEKAIRMLARTSLTKDRVIHYILEEEYILALVEVFHVAEKAEDLETLHSLCTLMQTILLLNDHRLCDQIIKEEFWMGVIGMLEYDPEFPTFKANYREFLQEHARFMQPIRITDVGIRKHIHQVYRMQYLRDVILGRALDDSTFNVLNSFILFNQGDILTSIKDDETFLRDIIRCFVPGKDDGPKPVDMEVDGQSSRGSDPVASTSSSEDITSQPKDVFKLVQQICVTAKNLQVGGRIALYRSLLDRGILYPVQWAVSQEDKHMVSLGGEVLGVMLDHDPAGVRGHIMRQVAALNDPKGAPDPDSITVIASGAVVLKDREKPQQIDFEGTTSFKETLLQALSRYLARSKDLAVQNQLTDALRTLLEVPQADNGARDRQQTEFQIAKMFANRKDDPITEHFLDHFYKAGVDALFRPITNEVPRHQNLKDTVLTISREKANLYLYLCDLLSSFLSQHSFRSHFFVLTSNIASSIASLLNARDKHLRLAALRFFRTCIKLNNLNLNKHLKNHDVFTAILELTVRESKRDNLLSSTCQEFFDFMRKENMKDLIAYVVLGHEEKIKTLATSAHGATTFRGLLARWEMNNEPPPKEEEALPAPKAAGRRWGQGKLMESEEEDYFNAEDEEEEPPFSPSVLQATQNSALRRKRANNIILPNANLNQQRSPNGPLSSRASPLISLVEYGEEDDAEGPSPSGPEATKAQQQPSGAEVSGPSGASSSTTSSPSYSHRQIHIPPSKPPDEDPEDAELEMLVTNGRPAPASAAGSSSPKPQPVAGPSSPPVKPREKRRRDEDDEDEMLGLLASKHKKTATGGSEDQLKPKPVVKLSPSKPEDDHAPRKLKVKFNSLGRALSASPTPSTKDSDEG